MFRIGRLDAWPCRLRDGEFFHVLDIKQRARSGRDLGTSGACDEEGGYGNELGR
jgi:hypothetical protein